VHPGHDCNAGDDAYRLQFFSQVVSEGVWGIWLGSVLYVDCAVANQWRPLRERSLLRQSLLVLVLFPHALTEHYVGLLSSIGQGILS
jgi:hypothetical protein